jgi:hypothetical protein
VIRFSNYSLRKPDRFDLKMGSVPIIKDKQESACVAERLACMKN